MAVKATARATFYKREKGSYTFLRYSNDGGQTFTAADPAKVAALPPYPKCIIPQTSNYWEAGKYSQTDGSKVDDSAYMRTKELAAIEGDKTYVVKTNSAGTKNMMMCIYDASKVFLRYVELADNSMLTTLSGDAYIGCFGNVTLNNFQNNFYAQINTVNSFCPAIFEPYKADGRNLLLATNQRIANPNYPTMIYKMAMPIIAGEKVTITLHGHCSTTYFSVYNSGGEVSLPLKVQGENTHAITNLWPIQSTYITANNRVNIYAIPNNNLESTIDDIKIEYGDTYTGYTPAQEDVLFGTTEGEYMGTLVWDKPYPSNNPADYTWGKVKGETGKGISGVTEYYQINNSATTAPTSWLTTPPAVTAANRYLWNYEKITYTDGTSTDTQKRVVGVYGDTGKGISSVTNYYLATTAGSGVTTSTGGWTTSVQAVTAANRYLWNYEVISYTDGTSTTVAPHIIGVWGDTGPQGPKGDQGIQGQTGAAGKDAVTVRLVPDKVVVDTDTGGHVTAAQLANAVTTVEAYKGGAACAFTIGTPSASSGIGYTKTTTQVTVASISDDPSTGYAYGSGYVDIPVTVDGVVYTVRLTVETNIHKVVATLKQTATEITASVSSLTQTVDSNKTTTDARIAVAEGKINTNVTEVSGLKTRMSNVEQTAEGISMTVGEKMLAGNMLTGTLFRREEEVTWNNPAYKGVISTAVQLGGVNSVYLESSSTTQVSKGVMWEKIPVTAGKTYNMSFWYRTPDAASNGNFTIEVRAYKADGTQAAVFRPLVNWQLPIPANDMWQLYQGSVTVDTDVASVNVLFYLVTKGKMYIARPMLIEGSYVGWQRSEQDYDYIGGNLLDETKMLVKRGNLTGIIGTVEANAVGVCSSVYASATSEYADFISWKIPYDLNADYTLSFMAKGTGKIWTFIYSDASTADVALFTETECETYDVDVWGSANYTLTPDWKRRTVRWRTKGTRTQANAFVVIRVDQSSEAYIAQPKLEKGCTATAWTDGDGDMVSTKALLATGIDIENRKVTITADNMVVRNNSGETTALLDETGKIQTNLVVASVIKTGDIGQPHVEAKGSEFKIFGYEVFPFIELAWREDVGSVLRFYDEKTGQALYDLGPSGITANIDTVPDKWTIVPLKSLTTSSRLAAILDVTENDCTKYYQFVEGYKQLNGMKQYNVSGTSSPSGYSGKMYVQQSYNSAVISDGWYVGVNNGNYMTAGTESMDTASTPLYMCNLLLVSGGKVTNSAICYFTEADKRPLTASKFVGRDKDGKLLGTGYPYLWSYGLGLPSKE